MAPGAPGVGPQPALYRSLSVVTPPLAQVSRVPWKTSPPGCKSVHRLTRLPVTFIRLEAPPPSLSTSAPIGGFAGLVPGYSPPGEVFDLSPPRPACPWPASA